MESSCVSRKRKCCSEHGALLHHLREFANKESQTLKKRGNEVGVATDSIPVVTSIAVSGSSRGLCTDKE